jgi:hypothetical protein
MSSRVWRFAALVIAVIGTAGAASAFARSTVRIAAHTQHSGVLSGDWSGYIGSASTRQRMQITVNARETAGTWRISASCHGALTIDSISDGYHHFRRHVASGASCAGGDVDCLKRAGADLYDAVTSHLGGSWDTSGTLKRASH